MARSQSGSNGYLGCQLGVDNFVLFRWSHLLQAEKSGLNLPGTDYVSWGMHDEKWRWSYQCKWTLCFSKTNIFVLKRCENKTFQTKSSVIQSFSWCIMMLLRKKIIPTLWIRDRVNTARFFFLVWFGFTFCLIFIVLKNIHRESIENKC